MFFFNQISKEDKGRVEIFKNYAKKKKESVWQPFFHLLDRDDKFIVYQVYFEATKDLNIELPVPNLLLILL